MKRAFAHHRSFSHRRRKRSYQASYRRRLAFESLEDRRLLAVLPIASAADAAVSNVRPVLVVAADQTIKEGQLLDLSGQAAPILGLFIDSDTLDTHTATLDWGDGSGVETPALSEAAGSGVITGTHTYLNDGTYIVKVAVADNNGGLSDVGMFTVTVKNVRPVLVVAGDQTVDEGQLLDLTGNGAALLGLFVDAGTLDRHTATVDWGDGSGTSTPVINEVNGSGSLSGSHVYADDGIYTVKVTVTDDDGGSDVQSFKVRVGNINPSLTGTNNLVLNEGQSFTLTQLGVGLSDPGFDNPLNTLDPSNGGEVAETFPNSGFTVNWGDGTSTAAMTVVNRVSGMPGTPTTAQFDHAPHVYADNGFYTVTVTLQDDDGPIVTQTFHIIVNNVSPTLSVVGDRTATAGSPLAISNLGTFTDPGFDNLLNTGDPANGGETQETFTYTINWGDGQPTTDPASAAVTQGSPGVLTMGSFNGSHIYAVAGSYTVTVTIRDDNGGSDVRSFRVEVDSPPNGDPSGIHELALIRFDRPPIISSNVVVSSLVFGVTPVSLPAIVLPLDNTGSGGKDLDGDGAVGESPEDFIAAERALQAMLSNPHFARREEVIDLVHSLGEIELVSLLGIDMGDEPVFASKKKEAPQEREAAKPVVEAVEPQAIIAAAPSESGWKPLAFWSALAGGGTLWIGGAWWWNGRHRQNRSKRRSLR